MGGVNSYCIGRCYTTADAPENHMRNSKLRRNLSMTFTQYDNPATVATPTADRVDFDDSGDLININTAAEEELMTLPGVNRERARGIVRYRKQLGRLGFRKVEDLVLVPGIGGDRLTTLLPEITVGVPSSLEEGTADTVRTAIENASAMISLTASSMSNSNGEAVKPVRRVAVNTANVFQLMKLPGITQRQAEAIVAYREKNGRFENLKDLVKVKGFDATTLQAIRHRLLLEPVSSSSDSSACTDSSLPVVVNGNNNHGNNNVNNSALHPPSPDRKISAVFSNSQIDLLCALADEGLRERRVTSCLTTNGVNSSVLRVASWNLEKLTKEKALNPGVREVFCLTLWENHFGIVALQEVVDPKAVDILVSELNAATLPNTKKWNGHRGRWYSAVSEAPCGRQFQAPEYGAVIWDASAVPCADDVAIRLRSAEPLAKNGDRSSKSTFCRAPFIAHFEVKAGLAASVDLVLISVHLKAQNLEQMDETRTAAEAESLVCLTSALLQQRDPEHCALLLAGDFNLPAEHPSFTDLVSNGLEPALHQAGCPRRGSATATNAAGTRAIDNLWAGGAARARLGQSGVVREGMTHPFIPKSNFGWNGGISDHCPVWCELMLA